MSRIGHQINVIAKAKKIDPNRLRALFALERIVARLERNKRLSDSLTYKGGFVLVKTIDTDRFTRDLDALAHSLSHEQAQKLILEAVQADLNDGIAFGDPQIIEIETTGDYGGLRIDLCFQLDVRSLAGEKLKKLPRVHLDIGFGSKLPVDIRRTEMPSVTEDEKYNVSWSVYPLEFIFAEKLQALVILGSANSRAKDVYDMWRISELQQDQPALAAAIRQVFLERKTDLPDDLAGFVEKLDTLVLSNAWKSVLFHEATLSFEATLAALVGFLRGLKV